MTRTHSQILGIDPGMHGALALLDIDTGQLVELLDMPVHDFNGTNHINLSLLSRWVQVKRPHILMAVMEDPHAMPTDSRASAFAFGRYTGMVEGVVAAMGIGLRLVDPGTWKLSMGLGEDKKLSRAKAKRLWPQHAHRFRQVKDTDRAEAALLAKWSLEAARAVSQSVFG